MIKGKTYAQQRVVLDDLQGLQVLCDALVKISAAGNPVLIQARVESLPITVKNNSAAKM